MGDRRQFLISLVAGVPAATMWTSSILRAQQDEIRGGISLVNSGPSSVRIALPEFKPASSSEVEVRLTRVFNETLWNDLEFSGNIELASRSFYPAGNFTLPGEIRAEDWTGPGVAAAYIGFGSTATSGRTFSVEARLMDLRSPNQDIIIASRYGPGADSDQSARFLAHSFADAILERLGFGKGISRTKIAFVSNRGGRKEIYVMDYDGSNAFPLTAVGNIAITPAWAPDGQRVAYSAWRNGPANIEIVSTNGQRFPFQQVQAVTNTTPAWSPDGSSIAYSSSSREGTDIYIAASSGSGRQRLTQARQIDTSPAWNPASGNQIAFVSNRNGTPQIYTMAKDGTDVRQLTNEGGETANPAYSPDGRFIAFAWSRRGAGGFEIYLHQIATGRNTQLTETTANNEKPTWAPDGKHIAFQSNRSGTTQIYSMLTDGTKVRQLTHTGGTNEGPAWSGYIP